MRSGHRSWFPAAVAAAWMLAAGAAHAQAPAVLPVQGFLTDASGTPIDGATDVTFALYAAETGGTPVFSEMQSVMVEGGYFSAYIGDVGTLELSTFRDRGTVFIGVRVGADAELTPRLLLGSVPYAAYAEFAGAVPFAGVTGVPAGLADGDDVGPSYTAGTGIAITGTTISANPSAVQTRVGGTCPAGQSIRAIAADGTVTCEADDDTTYTAGTGLSLTGSAFAVDSAAVQVRVSGSCPVGQSIRAIDPAGAVTCEVDDNTPTTYTAGTGLTLTGTTFAVNAAVVQARVAGSCPVGQSIRAIDPAGAVACEVDDDTVTTYAAGAGLTLTGTTFAANTAVVQARIAGSCPAGQSIRAIDAAGAVACEVDDNTPSTYTAGTGLTLSGTTFAADTATLQVRVAASCVAGQSIRAIDAAGNVTCEVDDNTPSTYTAGTGLTLSGTTFAANTAVLQARVGGSCIAGQSIRAIDAAGNVICEVDDNTPSTYTAGTGLTLTGTTFAANTAVVQARVAGSCAAGQSIRVIDALGNVTCEVDDNTGTTYTAGSGLTLTGTTFSFNGQIGAPTDVVRRGSTGTQAAASGWQPDPVGLEGIWLEDGTVEGGGFFANGNMAAIWSPADASYIVSGASTTTVNGVLLALFDEDNLTAGSTARPQFIFANGVRAIDTYTGAFLSSGGAWTNSSDRRLKENITPIDGRAALARLRRLPIYEWNYIAEADAVRHVGPMAQDFHAAFGLNGGDETHIATVDADGVIMASIVAVADENESLRQQNARLVREVATLEARMSRIERLLAGAAR